MLREVCLVIVVVGLCVCCAAPICGAASASKTKIHREGDRVWLGGVTGYSFAERVSSVQAAQETVMHAVGEDISYDYLVGVCGLAFRMQVFKDSLCPSSPHAAVGYQCVARGNEALPWKSKFIFCKPDDQTTCSEVRKMAKDSIDRGIPVVCSDNEDGVIIGYQKGGAEWICLNPMQNGGKKSYVETDWPYVTAIYTERKQEMAPGAKLERESLVQAVKMAETEQSGNYYVGSKAWSIFTDRIQALEKADEKTLADSMSGNAWIYECLVSHRQSAARYLRSIAGDFPASASTHLLRAADLYEKMATQVLTDKDHCTLTVAPYDWSLKKGEKWTAEMRADEVQRLQKALPLERLALREIGKALAATPE